MTVEDSMAVDFSEADIGFVRRFASLIPTVEYGVRKFRRRSSITRWQPSSCVKDP